MYENFHFGAPVDEHGNPVKKTKATHPYSYDSFVVWSSGGEPNATVYTDRLVQWDREKYDTLSRRHFGDAGHVWYARKPEQIQNFLREWTDDQTLELVRVMECCNVSTGYPLWRLDYNTTQHS